MTSNSSLQGLDLMNKGSRMNAQSRLRKFDEKVPLPCRQFQILNAIRNTFVCRG